MIAKSRVNAVGAEAEWTGRYVQVTGTVTHTGYLDRVADSVVISRTWRGFVAEHNDETIRYPFVALTPDGRGDEASIKCLLQPGWDSDLEQANAGRWLRASAYFVAVDSGTSPPTVLLRECRIREVWTRAPEQEPPPATQ